jgi:hypothetical protein
MIDWVDQVQADVHALRLMFQIMFIVWLISLALGIFAVVVAVG